MANIKAVFHKKNENGTYDDVDLYTSSDIVSFDPTDSPLISTYVEGAIKELAGMTSDSIFGVLSSDSQNIPTDANGNNGIYTNAVTTMKIYNGNTDDTLNWTISATPSTSITGTLNGSTYSVTNMTEDTGYVDMIATRIDYPTITKRFSLSKSKQGANSIFYTLNLSTLVINKNELGEYTPPTITATLFKTIGAELPIEYSGRFIIAETTDGINYTNTYTSSANETSKTYTPTSNVESIRIRGYLADDFGTKIVENQVVIVTDGEKGADGASLYTWIKYADTPTTGMSDDPTGKLYMGIASNKTTDVESSVYSDYTWSLIKGTDGTNGVNPRTGYLTADSITLPADYNGVVLSFSTATGTFKVFNGTTDVTTSSAFSKVSETGCTSTINATTGVYSVTAMSVDYATAIYQAVYGGVTIQKILALGKSRQGAQGIIVSSTAPTNPVLNQLWQDTSALPNLVKKWNGTAWVLNYFYAENISATNLSAISANLGTITAGDITGVNITGTTITNPFNVVYEGATLTGNTVLNDSEMNIDYILNGNANQVGHIGIEPFGVSANYKISNVQQWGWSSDQSGFFIQTSTTNFTQYQNHAIWDSVRGAINLSDITTGNCKIMSGYITVYGTGVNYTQVFTLAQVRTIFGVGTEKTTNNFTASLMNGNEGVNNHRVYAPSWNQSISVLWAGFDKVLASGAPLQINYILTMT